MAPAAAHRKPDVSPHASLAASAPATSGLVVGPLRMVALDPEHQRHAVAAFLDS